MSASGSSPRLCQKHLIPGWAITEAFAALRADGTAGLPGNLAVLRSPLLRMVAVRY